MTSKKAREEEPGPHLVPPPREIRPKLIPVPECIRALQVDEDGTPVPWSVQWVNGRPTRMTNRLKWWTAVKDHLCWTCGQKLNQYKCFILHPLSGITRTTLDPPSHQACARWVVLHLLHERPGIQLLWTTKRFAHFAPNENEVLIRVENAEELSWWREGRRATTDEIRHAIEAGLPLLRKQAEDFGGAAPYRLEAMVREFDKYL